MRTSNFFEEERPKVFEDVVGNEHIKRMTRRMLGGIGVRPGVLLYGPPGCGKNTIGRLLARAIVCRDRPDTAINACGRCGVCDYMMRSGAIFGEGTTTGNAAEVTLVQLKDALQQSYLAYARPVVLLLDEFARRRVNLEDLLVTWLEDENANFVLILVTPDPAQVEEPLRQRLTPMEVRAPTSDEMLVRLRDVARRRKFDVDDDVLRRICTQHKNVPRLCLGALKTYALTQGL